MSNDKKTTPSKSNDNAIERDFFVPEYGVTVKATSIDEAVEIAKATVSGEKEEDA